MVDPISIASATTALLGVGSKVLGYIIVHLAKIKVVDSNIQGLSKEIESLMGVITTMKESFSNETDTLDSGTGIEAQHWRNVKNSLSDCHSTLTSLQEIWENMDKTDKGIFPLVRPKKFYHSALSKEKIASHRWQISSYRQTLHLSLQAVITYSQSRIECDF
jgi:hypothetical protein